MVNYGAILLTSKQILSLEKSNQHIYKDIFTEHITHELHKQIHSATFTVQTHTCMQSGVRVHSFYLNAYSALR